MSTVGPCSCGKPSTRLVATRCGPKPMCATCDLRRILTDQRATVGEPITTRQAQVLQLLADGLTRPMVAGVLGVSDQTIKSHLEAVRGRLGAHTTAQCVAIAMRAGWIC